MFPVEKLLIKICENFVEFFSSILSSRQVSAYLEPKNWKWEDIYTLSTHAKKRRFLETGSDVIKIKNDDDRTVFEKSVVQNRHENNNNREKETIE